MMQEEKVEGCEMASRDPSNALKEKCDSPREEKVKTEWTKESLQRLLADAISYKSPMKDIEVILRCGGKVNAPVRQGLRPLHYAAYVNYTECVQFLIDKAADVNVTDDIGYTPLHLCARHGFLDTMKILIDNGAILNYCDSNSEQSNVDENSKSLGYLTLEPLNMTIENNHIECVRLLLENGAKPTNKYFMGYEINLVPFDHLEIMELLLQHGADPNVFNRCGLSPLMKASRERRTDVVDLLLKYGANVNAECPRQFDAKTAIHFAILGGSLDVLELLLKNGANLSKHVDYKFCPLHTAVMADRFDMCQLLLLWRAEVDSRTDDFSTPLMTACAAGDLKQRKLIVQTLLENGADVNAHSPYVSYTDPCLSPLTEYLKNNGSDLEYDVIHMLISYGAKVNFRGDMTVFRLKDPFGILTYISNLKCRDDPEILEFLLKAAEGYDIEAIKRTEMISHSTKEQIGRYCNRPRELKHLVRLNLRKCWTTHLPTKIDELPLPTLIKSYLLFESY